MNFETGTKRSLSSLNDHELGTVIYVPGMGRSGADTVMLSGLLEGEARVVAVDRPRVEGVDFSTEAEVERILHKCRAASRGGRSVVLAGHSFGGYLAELAALRLTRAAMPPRALLLVDSSSTPVLKSPIPKNVIRCLTRPVVRGLDRGARWVDRRNRVAGRFLSWSAAMLHENAAYRTTAETLQSERLRDPGQLSDVPVLVLAAEGTRRRMLRILPWSADRKQRQLARILRARLIGVDRSGHHVVVDRPDAVAKVVRSVLRRPGGVTPQKGPVK